MTLRLKDIVDDILQRHIAAAVEEIAAALDEALEARVQDRIADLRSQPEFGDKP